MVGGRLAPPGSRLSESGSEGRGQPRPLGGESRWLRRAVCRREAGGGGGGGGAGAWAERCGLAGGGRRCVVGRRPRGGGPACSPRAGRRPPVQGTGRAGGSGQGGGAVQSQAQRQQRQPGALFLEQRQARRGRAGARGRRGDSGSRGAAGLGRERGGGRPRRPWRRPAGSPPSPGQPAPGPRLRRPRSPRPPPSQRRASSRPESPGNH